MRSTKKECEKRFYEWLDNHSDYQLIGSYINTTSPIEMKHLPCGNIVKPRPADLFNGHGGCKHCSQLGNDRRNKRKNITYDELLKLLGEEFEIISPIKDEYARKEVIIIKHKKCQSTITKKVVYIIEGTKCKLCMTRAQTKEPAVFIKELNDINPNIEVLGEYVNTNSKIKLKCLLCGNVWDAVPYSVLQGHGCPKCKGLRLRKTQEEWEVELRNCPDIDDYEFLDMYKTNQEKIKVKHKNLW